MAGAIPMADVGRRVEGAVSVWTSMRRLSPLFMFAGIYTRSEDRKRYIDVFAKIYSVFVMSLMAVFSMIDMADVITTHACTGMFLYKVSELVAVIELFLMYIIWIVINQKAQSCCDVIEKVQWSLKRGTIKKLPFIISITKGVMMVGFMGIVAFCAHTSYVRIVKIFFSDGILATVTRISFELPLWLFFVKEIIRNLLVMYRWYTALLFQAIFTLWCYLLYNLFTDYNSEADSRVSKDNPMTPDDIEQLHANFEKCLNVVKQLDRCCSMHVGVTLAYSMVILCIMIYFFASSSPATAESSYAMGHIMVTLVMTAACPVLVYNTMYSCRELLYQVNFSELSDKSRQLMQLFLTRLNGPPVGMTAAHFILLDFHFLMTIAGTLITYTIVIFQFNPSIGCDISDVNMIFGNVTSPATKQV